MVFIIKIYVRKIYSGVRYNLVVTYAQDVNKIILF